MDVPRGVGQVDVEVAFGYGGFPSRRLEYLVSQFDLKSRLTGKNGENLEYIKSMSGVRLYVNDLPGKDGVSILIQHPSIAGMKQGFETIESLLDQVTSDFETLRESERISDLEWKLQRKIKSCICPECGKMKNHIKDLEQHFNGQHIGEKYDMMTVKISGTTSAVRRSTVERALGEFGSISYIDMESHHRDIYVKFVRPVAVEKILSHKRRIVIDGKQVQVARAKLGELDDLREALKRNPRDSHRREAATEPSVLVPYQSEKCEKGWTVDKFVDASKEGMRNFHPTRLYVRGFPRETDRRQLKDFFSQYGRPDEVRVKDAGTSKAYAFVEFRTRVAMEKIFGERDVSYLPYGETQLTLKRVAVKPTDEDQVQRPDMSDLQPETVRQIYVEGFPQLYDQRDLMSYFKVYGEIKKCTLVKASGDQPRHAFVTFTNMTAVEELIKEMTEAGGLYIRGKVLNIERRSDQIENAIRKRADERQRKLQSEPVIEHQTGVAKTGLPLKDIKERLDLVARQLSSHDTHEVSSQKFWALRKQWEWLNTTQKDLEKEAEWEIFGLPRSDGLKASTLAAAARKLQEALEKLVNAGTAKETSSSYTRDKSRDTVSTQSTRDTWGVLSKSGGSAYDRLPSGTTLTGQDWRAPPQSANNRATTWTREPPSSGTAAAFFGSPLQQTMGYRPNFMPVGFGAQASPFMGVPVVQKPKVADNLQPVDMDVSDDEDGKQDSNWSANPGKGISYDPYRISVMGFTPLVFAKDLQKMFTCYGLAREVKIYLENDMRYAFMIFSKQKAIRNLFKGKLAVNVQMKDMKLICNRILEKTKPGPFAIVLSEVVEEPDQTTTSSPVKPVADDVPIALPIQAEQLMALQLLANVEHLVSPPREKPITEDEMLQDLQEREVRMVPSLQFQLGQENPERVVRILKHLRCIHSDIAIQKILYYLSNDEVVDILCSTSKPELVTAVQKFAYKIEEAKAEATEVNLYHCIRKMVLVMNEVAEKKRPASTEKAAEGATESHPILISDADPEPTKQRKPSRWSQGDDSRAKTSGFSTAALQRRYVPLQEKRKGLQKLLGELPSDKRRKVEEIFRAKVDERRSKGEAVSEVDEIDLYIEALGDIGKRQEKDRKYSEDRGSDSHKDREKRHSDKHPKPSPSKKQSDHFELKQKGKSSSNGKISLEGLNTAEKRVIIKKAMDEIPPFVASKVKSKQKLTITAMKKEGKEVGEVEEMHALAEAFNHMFNEEGNIMSYVLKDQIFKRRNELNIKKDSAVKQLLLPRFDKQVQQFRRMEQTRQTEEMKKLRESLSVLLKILLFKKQDKVFEDAEKSGLELSKQEKNIIRYQILLDMTQAVIAKREEKEKGVQNISPGNYQAESQDSQDEFDDDSESIQGSNKTIENEAHKRSLDESDTGNPKKMKTSDNENNSQKAKNREHIEEVDAIVIDDDEEEEEDGENAGEKEMVQEENKVDCEKNVGGTEMVQEDKVGDNVDKVTETEMAEEEDEVDKLLKEISSDDEEVDIDEFDESKLLEEIKESSEMGKEGTDIQGKTDDAERMEESTEGSSMNDEVHDKGESVSEEKNDSFEGPADKSKGPADKSKEVLDAFMNTVNLNKDSERTSEKQSDVNLPVIEAESSREFIQDSGENNGSTLGESENTEPQKEDEPEESPNEVQETKEEIEERLENAFREILTPAQRRSILGRTTKAKKARLATGNEMTDEEIAALRYKMINDALVKKGK